MAPKKAPKNAYFYYMMEFQRIQKAKGNDVSIAEASTLASDSWKTLNDAEKEKYKQMASKEKENNKIVLGPPKTNSACQSLGYTSQGVPLSMVIAEEKRKKADDMEAKEVIRKLLIDGKRGDGVDRVIFSFIHMNMFFENYPCEVAVTKFSIDEGIIDTHHSLIKVSKLPLGSAFEAKQLAEKTHGLPLPPKSTGNDDHFSILYDIKSFVSTKRQAVLFCRPEDMENIKNGLTFLDGCCDALPENFILIDIVELFYQMQKTVFAGLERGNSITYGASKVIIDRDTFDSFVKGCQTHDALDLNVHCSESITKRLAYQFIDTFARTFGTIKQAGHHYPAHRSLKVLETDLESLVHDMHIGTSDETETDTCYESEPIYNPAEVSITTTLNNTNPFYMSMWKETGTRPKQPAYVPENYLDSTFGADVSDEEEGTVNISFQARRFKQLLKDVRDGNYKH